MKTIPLTIIVAILLMGFCATGCALIKLKDDVNQSLESTVIVGRIYAEVSGKGPIIVAACPMNERKTIAHYTVLHGPGEYELIVDQGDYYVFAYRDKNSNLIYEAGEPAGQYSDPDGVRAPAVGVVFDIDIAIPGNGEKLKCPWDRPSHRFNRSTSTAGRRACLRGWTTSVLPKTMGEKAFGRR